VADFEITVSGLREVQKSLYSYSQQLGDKVVLDALRLGARAMQAKARAGAPKITGRLRRGIVVKKSKINNGKRKETLGVYLTLRTGKGRKDPKDAFYGRFLEDGWNARGKSNGAKGKGKRFEIVSRFGKRTGRKTLPSARDIPGIKFMQGAFNSTKQQSANLIVQAVERGAEILKRKIGLK
jgi:HK97 gp10 family phage protein